MYSTLDKKHKRNLLFFFLFIFLVLENNSGPHPVTKNKQTIYPNSPNMLLKTVLHK